MRLLDFGLAQMAEFDTLTALGDVPGTLAYIAPERLQGATATTAADVWACRRPPLGGARRRAPLLGRRPVETSRRIQQGAPPLELLRPDLPRHCCDTVASALLPNPRRRPSAARLAHELRTSRSGAARRAAMACMHLVQAGAEAGEHAPALERAGQQLLARAEQRVGVEVDRAAGELDVRGVGEPGPDQRPHRVQALQDQRPVVREPLVDGVQAPALRGGAAQLAGEQPLAGGGHQPVTARG